MIKCNLKATKKRIRNKRFRVRRRYFKFNIRSS